MEINVVELVVQAGALGLTAILLVGLWRYGGGMVSRVMDNLDAQTHNVEATIAVQAEVAKHLEQLTARIVGSNMEQRAADATQANTASTAQAELIDVLKSLSAQIDSHESRAQARHRAQLKLSGEMCTVLKELSSQRGAAQPQ